jgi:hypothetical protein
VNAVHVWRPRRSRFGELIQRDTSEHDWLEGRGGKLYLIAMIDDAASRLFARFVRHDSTEENMRLLWSYLEKYGRADPANADDSPRPLDKSHNLAVSLSHVETRQARNDYTIPLDAGLYRIERQAVVSGRVPAGYSSIGFVATSGIPDRLVWTKREGTELLPASVRW